MKLYLLVLASIVFIMISCDENYRNLGQYNDDYQCIEDRHCGLDFICSKGYCKRVCPEG